MTRAAFWENLCLPVPGNEVPGWLVLRSPRCRLGPGGSALGGLFGSLLAGAGARHGEHERKPQQQDDDDAGGTRAFEAEDGDRQAEQPRAQEADGPPGGGVQAEVLSGTLRGSDAGEE